MKCSGAFAYEPHKADTFNQHRKFRQCFSRNRQLFRPLEPSLANIYLQMMQQTVQQMPVYVPNIQIARICYFLIISGQFRDICHSSAFHKFFGRNGAAVKTREMCDSYYTIVASHLPMWERWKRVTKIFLAQPKCSEYLTGHILATGYSFLLIFTAALNLINQFFITFRLS